MKLLTVIGVAAVGLTGSHALLGQGCGGTGSAMKEGCAMMTGAAAMPGGHGGHGSPAAAPTPPADAEPAAQPVMTPPVQAVFNNYLRVQSALAKDSLEGIAQAATDIGRSVQGDPAKRLSPHVAQQAAALGQAKDLAAAREALKPLSRSLIEYLRANQVPAGTYHEAYCPMAKASWLQTDKTIANPYMGQGMLRCGQFKS